MIATMAPTLLFSLAALSHAQTPPILSVPTSSATLGEIFVLSATAQESAQEWVPDLPASTTESFSISGIEDLGAENSPRSWRIKIVPLAVGPLEISLVWTPAGAVPAGTAPAGASSPADNRRSAPVMIQVAEPPLAADADIQDIKPPRRARPRLWPWLVLLIAAAAIAAILRRRRKYGGGTLFGAQAEPLAPPEQEARSRLSALASSGMWERQQFKAFYAQLTEILREYLQRRYRFPAEAMTSLEIARGLREPGLNPAPTTALPALKSVFERADWVKFAKIEPQARWGPEDIGSALKFVELTTPVAVENGKPQALSEPVG